jgi:hypothetical protein
MITVQITDDDRPLYTARVGRVSPATSRPARYFCELLDDNKERVAYSEVVSYTDDTLKVVSMLLTAAESERRVSLLR